MLAGKKGIPWVQAAFSPGPLARERAGSAWGFCACTSHGSPQEGSYAKTGIREKPKGTQAGHSRAEPSLPAAPASAAPLQSVL